MFILLRHFILFFLESRVVLIMKNFVSGLAEKWTLQGSFKTKSRHLRYYAFFQFLFSPYEGDPILINEYSDGLLVWELQTLRLPNDEKFCLQQECKAAPKPHVRRFIFLFIPCATNSHSFTSLVVHKEMFLNQISRKQLMPSKNLFLV